ncbi:MAG TPA: Bax inhibitor-1/YccA family protein [Vitreimonas sp.]|uniref:Bax inhibitor-1/YccA family protein n=1 Tax=Vitreimonas sp. TaxID=3069702 RepID=UPI002D43BB56|nr:Bax inhibitor-1/YccA family protein [Vitreimonas sp.]HYD88448.1 Bax inhibitor-1/YccA family protein [Vitreimonas sp.]
MSDYHTQARSIPTGRADMAVDAGLRKFMLGVYNKMALGLLVSAVLAYASIAVEPLRAFFFGVPFGSSPMIYVVMFGPLALIFISMFAMRNPSPTGANLLYWSIVGLIGIGLGVTLMVYGGRAGGMTDIMKAFLVTSATFGGLSLWGYTTKKDLSGWGTFLIMGVWGLVLASLVNFGFAAFTGQPIENFSFIISIVGVLLFSAITAWETQQLKYMYYDISGNERAMSVATTLGALNLYITFINLFRFFLTLLSSRE